jgi:hypothetical protein
VSPRRSTGGQSEPRTNAFEAFELWVGPVSLRRQDRRRRTNPLPSLYSGGLLLANERFDQNCQLRSLNIPSKERTSPQGPRTRQGFLAFADSTRSLRGNDRQTLYSGSGDHERISDGSAPTHIHQLRKLREDFGRAGLNLVLQGMKVTCRFAQAKTSSSCRSSSRSTSSGRRDAPR